MAVDAVRRGDPMATHVAVASVLGLVCAVIWFATGAGYFWPGWAWYGLLATVLIRVGWRRFAARPRGPRRVLETATDVLGFTVATNIVNWLGSGAGYFWPVWNILASGLILGLIWLWAERRAGSGELAERVTTLERTRRGALDVQDAELRRIERDLHDGAQARLVALTMQLGRAEARLDDRPELAELIRGARGEATAAIGELRDLARGIAPPVLADRGLPAAAEALGERSAVDVELISDLKARPVASIETAAYFVVSEALTNVAKHAPQARATVRLRQDEHALVVSVGDDGPGGADPAGSGLTGLRSRVEALDGTLSVRSAPGGPTLIEAVLPCEW